MGREIAMTLDVKSSSHIRSRYAFERLYKNKSVLLKTRRSRSELSSLLKTSMPPPACGYGPRLDAYETPRHERSW